MTTNGGATTPVKESRYEFSYGKGRFPILLVLFWLAFFAWFFWFVIRYQLPEFRQWFAPAETSVPAQK
mgnify:CR=1 FL=1